MTKEVKDITKIYRNKMGIPIDKKLTVECGICKKDEEIKDTKSNPTDNKLVHKKCYMKNLSLGPFFAG